MSECRASVHHALRNSATIAKIINRTEAQTTLLLVVWTM